MKSRPQHFLSFVSHTPPPAKTTPAFNPHSRLKPQESGVALVITLSMLLITTIIIVAFFSRAQSDLKATSSYSASVQSDLLASGAMDQVVGNFLEEIADPANSTAHPTSGFTWFEPLAVANKYPSMVPHRSTGDAVPTTTAFQNLIKQSNQKNGFRAGIDSLASTISTKTASMNGRAVAKERWDLPALLGDTTLQTFDDSQVPDWIYMTSNGGTTTTVPKTGTNTPQIVGRYAYNVYDVGGLLNINVAGNGGATDEAIASKGSLALADLTQLPGMNATAIKTLLDWRAPDVHWATTGSTSNLSIDLSNLTLLDYIEVGNTSGWLRNPAKAGTGNQFLSRRDLIKYAKVNSFENALPFLTHFSVDVDAPSFSPDTSILKLESGRIKESGTEYSGGNYMTNLDQKRVNPTRFDADTLMSSFLLPNGQKAIVTPVLHKRFPLSWLGYVKTDKNKRTKGWESVAQKYFGLKVVDDFTWEYDDGDGDTKHIKSLNEVAAKNRDPNFFEILKSIIQVGSLGQHLQPVADKPEGPNGCLEPSADRVDDQIIRIGAAIIDQADEDSFPTRIQFNYDGSAFGEIYGVEDLPYIDAMRFATMFAPDPNTYDRRMILAQPTLWNPHNPTRRETFASDLVPSQFRITAYSLSPTQLGGVGWGSMSAVNFDRSQAISFSWSSDPSNPTNKIFRQPQGLLSKAYPPNLSVSTSGNTLFPSINSVEDTLLKPLHPYPGNANAVGFCMGTNFDSPPPKDPVTKADTAFKYDEQCQFRGSTRFELQYQAGGGGQFYTYDYIWFNPEMVQVIQGKGTITPDVFVSLAAGHALPNSTSFTTVRADSSISKTDPRSQRFMWPTTVARFIGFSSANTNHYAILEGTGVGYYGGLYSSGFYSVLSRKNSTTHPWWIYTSSDPGVANLTGGSSNDSPDFRSDQGFLSINSKKIYTDLGGMYYADHDNVVRRAMGGGQITSNLSTDFGIIKSGGVIKAKPYAYDTTGEKRVVGLPMQSIPFTADNEWNNPLKKSTDIYPNRPIVLNRPFRSVGELAYAFRDAPWKNIDFSFQESGDTGLLDAFCIYENNSNMDSSTPLVAGKVNLNTASKPVLEALLSNAAKEISTDSSAFQKISTDQVSSIADRILQYRSESGTPAEDEAGSNGPLRSLAELVGRVYSDSGGVNYTTKAAAFVGPHLEKAATGDDQILTESLSTTMRALADVGTTRTWNFMIDLVAQSGKLQSNSLEKFNANSESRWWMFVSIDRFTGKILARSIERVSE